MLPVSHTAQRRFFQDMKDTGSKSSTCWICRRQKTYVKFLTQDTLNILLPSFHKLYNVDIVVTSTNSTGCYFGYASDGEDMGQEPVPNHRRQSVKIHETVSLSVSPSGSVHNSFQQYSLKKKIRIFYKCKIDLLVFLEKYPQGSLNENTVPLNLANISQDLKTLLF